MSLILNSTAVGTLVEVLVAPRASKERVLGEHDGALKIALTAPPVDGEANAALIAFLACSLHVAKADVRIVRGQQSKRKTLELRGVAADAVVGLLEANGTETRSHRG